MKMYVDSMVDWIRASVDQTDAEGAQREQSSWALRLLALSICEMAETVAQVAGSAERLEFDASKPDGTPRKLMDVSRLTSLGWAATINLPPWLAATYRWYLAGLNGT